MNHSLCGDLLWGNGFDIAQVQMITGEITSPEDGATFTQDVADTWRQANRLLLEHAK